MSQYCTFSRHLNYRRRLSSIFKCTTSATFLNSAVVRASAVKGTLMNFFVRNCSQIRRFCAETARVHFKPRRKGPKNVAEVGSYLPNGGIGMKFTRVMWIRNGYENSYWTVTKILEKSKGRLRYYGKLTWKGIEDPRERPVRTGQKRGWRYILEGNQKTLNGKTAEDCKPPPPLVRAKQTAEG